MARSDDGRAAPGGDGGTEQGGDVAGSGTAAPMTRSTLGRYAWLSVAAAIATFAIKLLAWELTGSVGLLSDALESTVNLAAAIVMLVALRVAFSPPDDDHHFGHDKAELFSAALEGLMIVVAAGLILWSATSRLLSPTGVDDLDVGVALSAGASVLNLGVAVVLARAGRAHGSRALLADARHLMTDVVTSAGVIVGLVLVGVTGWVRLDPIVALAVGANVLAAGGRLVWGSAGALMDPALPGPQHAAILEVLARHERPDIGFHALRHRAAGHRRFLSLHVLVPGDWTVSEGHAYLERLEAELRDAVDDLVVFTHLEPIEDESSYADEELDRHDDGAHRPPPHRTHS